MIRALVIVAVLAGVARADDDPCGGLGGADLATCREDHDQLATAWRLWRELKDQARADGNTKLAALATEHITAIQPKLAYLTLALPRGGSPSSGLAVTVDGDAVPLDQLGTSSPIDGGAHEIAATAPGYARWSKQLTLDAGAFKTIEIGPLVPATDEPTDVSPGGPIDPPPEDDPAPPSPPTKKKWGGLVTAAVGVVVTGVGIWAGLDAKAKRDDAHALGCNADLSACPSGTALDTANAAYGRANLSTAFTLTGLVLGAGGAALWLTGTF